ncbi:hypothetical protein JHK87_039496 [Glycine soja]|nr:hypothetical protein JHK87_039496 [Glycine soja]
MDMMKKLKDLIHKLIQQYVLEHLISHSSSNSANSKKLKRKENLAYGEKKVLKNPKSLGEIV